jgi:cyclophilin family peptidyl-prolyl cis-trans isomerase
MGPDIGFSIGGGRIPMPGSYVTAAVTDTDGDAIADVEDNCPKVANTDQEDSDGDEVGDLCEPLPATMPQVRIRTTEGNFVVELNDELAPITVANFLSYVDDDFYAGTMFHRVDIDLGIIQGGGFTKDGTRKETNDPIVLEADNGLKNLRGTIAMARTNEPNSATSQFYVNTTDNPGFDPENNPPGYAVFGEVVSGMSVVDEVQALPADTVEILGMERM